LEHPPKPGKPSSWLFLVAPPRGPFVAPSWPRRGPSWWGSPLSGPKRARNRRSVREEPTVLGHPLKPGNSRRLCKNTRVFAKAQIHCFPLCPWCKKTYFPICGYGPWGGSRLCKNIRLFAKAQIHSFLLCPLCKTSRLLDLWVGGPSWPRRGPSWWGSPPIGVQTGSNSTFCHRGIDCFGTPVKTWKFYPVVQKHNAFRKCSISPFSLVSTV